MTQQRAGVGLVVAGVVLLAAGVIGVAAGSGDDRTSDVAAAAASTTTTSRATTTTTSRATTTTTSRAATTTTSRAATTTTAPAEAAEAFVTRLAGAIRGGDEAFLYGRLHSEVIARYGDATCRTRMETFQDETLQFAVREVKPPSDYDWQTDGRSTVVPGTTTVAVTRSQGGQSADVDIHITRVGDEFRWFTDCGEPAT